jgi:hypothetical protein
VRIILWSRTLEFLQDYARGHQNSRTRRNQSLEGRKTHRSPVISGVMVRLSAAGRCLHSILKPHFEASVFMTAKTRMNSRGSDNKGCRHSIEGVMVQLIILHHGSSLRSQLTCAGFRRGFCLSLPQASCPVLRRPPMRTSLPSAPDGCWNSSRRTRSPSGRISVGSPVKAGNNCGSRFKRQCASLESS